MLSDKNFKVVSCYMNSSDVFPAVDIKGGVAIGYRDVNQDFGAICTFTHNDIIKDILSLVLGGFKDSMAEILYSNTSYKYNELFYIENPEFKKRVSGGSVRYLSSSAFDKFPEVFYKNKQTDGREYIQILGRQKNKRVLYYFDRRYINPPENFESWKVYLPSSNGSGAIGENLATPLIGEPLIGEPLIGATETFISFGKFSTRFESESLLKYTKTRFARTMLGTKKVTQGNKNSKIWENVPLQNFSNKSEIDWTKSISEIDKQLYMKYKLTAEQIEYIGKNISEMK
jgi:hypothetical protein